MKRAGEVASFLGSEDKIYGVRCLRMGVNSRSKAASFHRLHGMEMTLRLRLLKRTERRVLFTREEAFGL